MRHYEDQNKNVVGDYEQNLNYRRPKVDNSGAKKDPTTLHLNYKCNRKTHCPCKGMDINLSKNT